MDTQQRQTLWLPSQESEGHQSQPPSYGWTGASDNMSGFASSSRSVAPSSRIPSASTTTQSAKRRRRSRADSDPPCADTSARAGPFGSDDDDDSEDEDSSPEETRHVAHLADEESRPPRRPPRKRPHLLLSEDVDRFSTMSMNDVQPTVAQELASELLITAPSHRLESKNDGRLATTPDPVLVAPPTTPTNLHKQASSAAIAVPLEEELDDVAMGKGASSWELDRHRTYVAELEDDEEDDDGAEGLADQNSSSEPQAFTQDELRQLSDLRDAARKNAPPAAPGDMADDDTSVGPAFEVNRELLAKLEAHALATLIGNDMSRRRKNTSTSSPLRRSAAGSRGRSPSSSDDEGVVLSEDGEARRPNQLVLWKSPEEILAGTTSSPAASVPLADLQSSDLLFGKGSPLDVYPQTFSPSFAPGLTATMRLPSSGSRSGTVTPVSLAEETQGTSNIEGSGSASMDLDEE